VFEGGGIIEDGSHDELLKIPNGFYANMYHTQAKHYQ
jgi:ABC-type multidrug transport system fused ATPase/permease subunit